jgi:hypothetical protein
MTTEPNDPGFCAVCLGPLEPDRTVDYCSQACRGLLRARVRAELLKNQAQRVAKLGELDAATRKRRRDVALAKGFKDERNGVVSRRAEDSLAHDANMRAYLAARR